MTIKILINYFLNDSALFYTILTIGCLPTAFILKLEQAWFIASVAVFHIGSNSCGDDRNSG